VSKRLKQATMIHSPSFPGAGRRWQLSLVARTADGFQLDDLPLYITVIDPTSLMVCSLLMFSKLIITHAPTTVAAVMAKFHLAS